MANRSNRLKRAAWAALLCALMPTIASAGVKEYVRDYTYQGAQFDTRATCRVNAIDGVKRELLDELGTYVGSVVKIHQDSLGNNYMSQDVVNITAGIVALKLLDERWNQPAYFVKASMKADPDDVLSKLKAMRADLEMEKSLRESYEELQQARKELVELKAQLARLHPAATPKPELALAAPKPAAPEPALVMKRMQQMEEQAQQEVAKNRVEEAVAPPQPAAIEPIKTSPPPRKANADAQRGQHELEQALQEEKNTPPPAVVMPVAPMPVPAPVAQPVAKPPAVPSEPVLVANYHRVAQTIEVEEAFQAALTAKSKGDFSTMFSEMNALANKGYAQAQVRLGWMYQRGLGVPQDFQQAHAWYEKARANGSPDAIAHIGNLYELGLGVEKDYLKAAALYQQAIDAGSDLGYSHLGSLYLTGRGMPFDRVKAAEYFRAGMEKGNYGAMAKLAFLYQHGRGGQEQDKRKAVELYQRAIDHGDALAMAWLGQMYNEGDGHLSVDHDKALSLLLEARRYNQPHAFAFLGYMYENGWSVGQDYAEARHLYEHAASLDVPFAELRLGVLYRDGSGVPRDLEKATYWLKRAASHGNDKAEKVLNHLTNRRARF